MRHWRFGAALANILASIAVSFICLGFGPASLPSFATQRQDKPAMSPIELVRSTVKHELADNHSSIKHMFRSHKKTMSGMQTRLFAETTQATADLLVVSDSKPVPPQQLQSQLTRLNQLAHSPQDLSRKQKQEKDDADRSSRIIRALPDAFVYEFDGTQTGTKEIGKLGDELIRLKFRPNPTFVPPSKVERVLLGMQGHLLIDESELRIAEIDATLFRDVTFGWGFLARLNKGGNFMVNQADVGEGVWELTRQRLNFTGKIMMIKSLTIKSDETYSDFQRIPWNTDFQKGVQLLQAEADQMRKGEDREAANSGSGR